ncbi:MAG: hypothetical protein IPM63_08250 [Acidobacteriota bacterium]|nr:MAG: hypothetical protein IPM63_08250 [Acidobacteriota bacterium]
MSRFVNKLSHRFRNRKGRGEELIVCVDNRSLLSIFESAIPNEAEHSHWAEKSDAELRVDELVRTADEDGEFYFYYCRECGIPEDLIIDPVEVRRKDGFVTWKVMPPYEGIEYELEDDEALTFRFDERQYRKALLKIRSHKK